MTDQPYVPVSHNEPVVRLCHRILVKLLTDRNRADLLREYDQHGARIEDHPAGLELFVGSESVTVVTEDALRLGVQLQRSWDNVEN